MNINDLAKNQLGQYGSVVLDASGETLNLVGSEQYVVTAIQCLADADFNYLTACTNKCTTTLCTSFGGENIVRVKSAADIDDTNNRIRVHGSFYKSIQVGDTFNYVAMDGTKPDGITAANMDSTIVPYYVTAKGKSVSATTASISGARNDSGEGWLQISTDATTANNITDFANAAFGKHAHKLVFPAITAPTLALFEADVDANTEDNFTGGGHILDTSLTFVAGTTIYGRWSYVDANTNGIICYLGPK